MGTCDTVDDIDLRRLSELELFAGADREQLRAISRRSMAIEVDDGRELVREGCEAREFVVILDGYAMVSVAGVPISYLGAGSCFGEMSLIDGTRRSATVTAASPMRLVVLTREDFLDLLAHEPSFCVRVLRMVVGRLRLADAQLAERAVAGSGSPSSGSGPARSVTSGARGDPDPGPGGRSDGRDR